MKNFDNSYIQPVAFRSAVLAVFNQTAVEAEASLAHFRERDWRDNLHWLDASGLALYLLERLTTLGLRQRLPPFLLRRLQQNLADNRVRNADLLAEAATINVHLQREGILFANLKGITLTPESVPDPGLRCQLDLDFLVSSEYADKAVHILERLGYVRDCVSGSTWEFKAGHGETAHLRDLYKSKVQRSAELHLTSQDSALSRSHIRTYSHTAFPVLSPPDLYLHQAMHLLKHVRSSFTRAAWLLEFHTHTESRREDEIFWQQLQELIAGDPQQRVGLGILTQLLERSFRVAPPPALARICEGALSLPMRAWIERYGQAALLSDFPGTKLYLLLEQVLQPSDTAARTVRRARLLPTRLPQMITHGHAGETLLSRARRYRAQFFYLLFRFRFHCVEGIRYVVESIRFRRILTGLAH